MFSLEIFDEIQDFDKNPKFYPENSIKDYSEYLLEDGDLLMSLTGDVGRVGFINKELFLDLN